VPPKAPHPNLDDAVARYASGQPLHEVLGTTGVSKTVLYRALRKRNLVQQRDRRSVNVGALISAYGHGASVAELARRFEVSRHLVVERLADNGIVPRSRSESSTIRWSQMGEGQRKAQGAGAHEAVRGRGRLERERRFRALTREWKYRQNRPERALTAALHALGLAPHPERAVGRYNVDIAVPPVAVEIFGGRFHSAPHHTRRLRERLEYLFDQGWALYIVWDLAEAPLAPAQIAQDVAAYVQVCRSEPPGGRRYRVVRGDGQLVAEGRDEGDDGPFVKP